MNLRALLRRAPLVFLLLCSCAVHAQERRYVPFCAGFYNIENLFDTIDSPDTDDKEYLPDGDMRWTAERYRRKLEHMSKVIADLAKDVDPNGVALLGLAEVENRRVVEDLVRMPVLKARGYAVVHYDSPDRRGVDVALIHDPKRYKVFAHRSHRLVISDQPDFLTRDQLVVSGVLENGDTLSVIVAHWPSRRGGEKRSMPMRRAAGQLGRHIVDSLLSVHRNAHVLYMGDLNDNPHDLSVRRDLRAAPRKQDARNGTLFNPMAELYDKGIGTIAWQDTWSLFDQVCLSPSLVAVDAPGYQFYGARVYNEPYLRQQKGSFAGYPLRTHVGTTYMDGYSDHFPVYVILVRSM
ncbi:MAG: endonuclease/exonuclease/phosphatase family protein [Flavobacteriales bacterium]|nr:endonuclease/exonuclease/phosphatase family protein [Flavobacteriales bacterium]